jgi:hypothetical protein
VLREELKKRGDLACCERKYCEKLDFLEVWEVRGKVSEECGEMVCIVRRNADSCQGVFQRPGECAERSQCTVGIASCVLVVVAIGREIETAWGKVNGEGLEVLKYHWRVKERFQKYGKL